MGGDTPPAYEDERPAHQICFKRPFWIDRYEVTNAQYGEPSELEACRAASSESNQARNCVNWFEAKFYCENRGARLPTEAEWEYAARGPDNWVYPWGDVFVAEYTVYSGNSGGRVARVGSLSPAGDSWIGAADMAGNVWEWVSSLHLPYPYRADDGREDQTYRLDVRSLRGGSWHSEDPLHHRGAVRNHYNVPQYAGDNLGFRCAASY
jgi:iron(II)-dependent oxidoreductase